MGPGELSRGSPDFQLAQEQTAHRAAREHVERALAQLARERAAHREARACLQQALAQVRDWRRKAERNQRLLEDLEAGRVTGGGGGGGGVGQAGDAGRDARVHTLAALGSLARLGVLVLLEGVDEPTLEDHARVLLKLTRVRLDRLEQALAGGGDA
jgi:hypothetical protein